MMRKYNFLRMAPVNLSKASVSGHCHYFSFILIFLLDQNASTWQKGRGLLHESLSRSCSRLSRLLICALYLSNHVQYADDRVRPLV